MKYENSDYTVFAWNLPKIWRRVIWETMQLSNYPEHTQTHCPSTAVFCLETKHTYTNPPSNITHSFSLSLSLWTHQSFLFFTHFSCMKNYDFYFFSVFSSFSGIQWIFHWACFNKNKQEQFNLCLNVAFTVIQLNIKYCVLQNVSYCINIFSVK